MRQRGSDNVTPAVRAAIEELGTGLYGVACSGGADSMALADATIAVAGPEHVVVITVDHGLSETSAKVAAEVAGWAAGRGAAALIERVTVPRRASIEAAARDARYAALERVADRVGLSAVLLGHTARDQAETVLMRILRGTGPVGLAGIPARRERFVRPLLELPRDAIDGYVAARALPVWSDPMNEDARIARVRIRRDVMPALRRENPQLDAALVRLARAAQEWLTVIDRAAEPFAALPIACSDLADQPAAVRKRALAIALERSGVAYDAVHLDALDDLIRSPARGQVVVDLPAGCAIRSYDLLHLARAADVADPAAAGAEPASVGATVPELRAPPGPYVLRPWRAGDRMRPRRLKGRSRKLSDLFIDARIPRDRRAGARVVVRTTDDVIVWAEHVGIAFGAPLDVVPVQTGGSNAPQTAGSF